MKHFLEEAERRSLEAQHKSTRDGLIKDRLKAILARDEGLGYEQIAQVLRLDESTVRRYVEEYIENKKIKPDSGGSSSKLNEQQTIELVEHLKKHMYSTAKAICHYVEQKYQVTYSRQGMTEWLIRNDFVFKQPIGVPAKANREAQEAWVQQYEKLKEQVAPDEPILFGDSVHPSQATQLARGWIHKTSNVIVPTTGSRTRLNITGALNLPSMNLITQESETVNAESFIQFMQKVETVYPDAPKIHLIVDQGPAHKNSDVAQFLTGSRIVLHLLPTYSPNLNPIERLWKIFHKHVSKNKYYPTAKDFKTATRNFFLNTYNTLKSTLTNTINDSFQMLPLPTN
jgi:transposase